MPELHSGSSKVNIFPPFRYHSLLYCWRVSCRHPLLLLKYFTFVPETWGHESEPGSERQYRISIDYLTCSSYSEFIHCATNLLFYLRKRRISPDQESTLDSVVPPFKFLVVWKQLLCFLWLSWPWHFGGIQANCVVECLSIGVRPSDVFLRCRLRLCILGSDVTRSHMALTCPTLRAVNIGHWTKVVSPRFPHGKFTVFSC